MQKAALLIVLGVLTIIGVIYISFDAKAPASPVSTSEVIDIVKRWDLPEVLEEVSGIAYMGNNRMACVQDEDGIIFIYDLDSSSIEKQIEFQGAGDFEAITIVGRTAYVLRSDGTIFEVRNFEGEDKKTTEHKTPITSKYNFEGLGHDPKNNRLLLAIKEKSGDEYKPIYAFNLETKQLDKEPVYKIYFNDPIFEILNKKVSRKTLRPSEITVEPSTGKIYILEGVDPKLLILDPSGNPDKLYPFNLKQFPQAEGLTFGNSGEMYISNEGKKGQGNILQIKLKK